MLVLECPHCSISIEIDQINCGIFRCCIFKNGVQIPPHLLRAECEKISKYIWGCGKPFKYENGKLIKCEYI